MVSLQSAENALKTYYLGVVANQLNTEINPLLAKIKQTTADVWGKEVRKMAPYGVNGGISSGTEAGDLPKVGGNYYVQFVQTLKNLYGSIEITDKAVRASENNAGAFVNLLNAEMEGLIKAASFNFGRMLYGDGTGTLATVTFPVSGTVMALNKVQNVIDGMIVDFHKADTKERISTASGVRITGINWSDRTVTLDREISGVEENDIVAVQGSYNNEITGLDAVFASSGSIYGLNRSEHTWLRAFSNNGADSVNDILLQASVDRMEERAGSRINFIACSSGVKRGYQGYLAQYRQNIDIMQLAGGFKALSFNGIPVVSDRFCPSKTMYLLNTDDFVMHQLCDWKWMEGEDGRVIKQVPGKPVYTATLVKYAELICNRINGQARFTNLAEQ